MPIREEMKDLYPDDWPEIRAEIRARAGDKCEGCGLANKAIGYRDSTGHFWVEDTESFIPDDVGKLITIVLTVAHVDHDPTNNDRDNLRLWCQKCHNGHDAQHRADGRRARKDKASGQMNLLGDPD